MMGFAFAFSDENAVALTSLIDNIISHEMMGYGKAGK
jgi:hypothetical protein